MSIDQALGAAPRVLEARPSLMRRTRARDLLLALRPPLRDARFWEIQALVFLASGAHDAMETLDFVSRIGTLYFVIVSLLLVLPVVLAAINFGRTGAVATGLWALAISSPNLAYWHSGSDRYGELVQMVIVGALAVLLGYWVDAERGARRRAEAAGAALSASEAKYRGLFETAAEPVLLVDSDGRVREANAAACDLFAVEPGVGSGWPLQGAGASRLLESLAATESDSIHAGPEIALQARDGRRVWVEPVSAPFGADGDGMLQVILRDVTRQRRRQRGLETYAARMLKAQEDERKRIAQELHDGTLHDMVLLCRRLEDASEGCAASPQSAVGALEDARVGIQAVADGLRNLARGLRPSVLDDLGLGPAVRALVERVDADSSLAASLSIRGHPRRLPADAELALFRIGQEAVRNAAQHSRGRRIDVELAFEPREVTLTVTDDGKGFAVPPSLDEVGAQRRLGLLGMQERARLSGAEFRLESAPGRGSLVQVRLAC